MVFARQTIHCQPCALPSSALGKFRFHSNLPLSFSPKWKFTQLKWRTLSTNDDDEGYLLDAPVMVGDGFSFGGGKYSDMPSKADEWFQQGKLIKAYTTGEDISKAKDPIFGLVMGQSSQVEDNAFRWFCVEAGDDRNPSIVLIHGLPSQVAETRFASYTIVLRRLVRVKEALCQMVISNKWGGWKQVDTKKAKIVKDLIFSDDFWNRVEYALELTEPLMSMLRYADTDEPCLGNIYDAMDSMLERMKSVIQRREQDLDTLYSTVEKIVLHRWNKMTTPLHLLAYALSPRYYSSEILDIPGRVPPYRDPEVAARYKRALNKLFSDPDVASNVRREFVDFVSSKFAEPDAINDQSRLDAIGWWYLHGECYMYLQPLAIKILSQAYSFRKVLPILSQDYHVIAFDWLGFGFSDKPQPKYGFDYTMHEYKLSLGSLLEVLGIKDATLVSQGYFAPIVVDYARAHQDNLKKLILINPPLTEQHAKLPSTLSSFSNFLLGEIFSQDPLRASDKLLSSCGPYLMAEEDAMVYRRPYLTSGSSGFALTAISRVMKKEIKESIKELRSILGSEEWKVSTTIIWGMRDRWLNYDGVEKYMKSTKHELIQLPKAGHHAQEDYGEEIGEVIRKVLKGRI